LLELLATPPLVGETLTTMGMMNFSNTPSDKYSAQYPNGLEEEITHSEMGE